ncbi:MAG TPA: arylesterase [Holophagaceae bacterium]|nr:arylesterase [Holophagaceae bacterium]
MRLRPALFPLLLLGAVSALPAAQPAALPAPKAKGTVVFLGDSLTAGYGLAAAQAYPALIQRKLEAARLPWEVVNAGVSGDTSAGGAARLDWIYRRKVDVLVVELGANDGLRGIPVADTERNLRTILDRAKREKSRVLLVGMQLPENYGPAYRKAFQAIFPRLAKAYRVAYLPFLLEGVAMRPELNQADGIHPNAEGARKVADTVWTALAPLLEKR